MFMEKVYVTGSDTCVKKDFSRWFVDHKPNDSWIITKKIRFYYKNISASLLRKVIDHARKIGKNIKGGSIQINKLELEQIASQKDSKMYNEHQDDSRTRNEEWEMRME